ncbi:MAG: iron complex outermembrane receptor protein [Flavobacteriales bacterium]|jgi:iron complex outermembrane receptor protein
MRKLSLIFITLFLSTFSYSQFRISGTITNQNSEPMPWATIQIKNTKYIATTNGEGYFEFTNLESGTYYLNYRYVGYKSTQYKAVIKDKEISASVSLQPKDLMINEITVSGTRIEENTPTTYTTINKEEIEKNNLGQDIPYLLQQSPSMVVTSDAGAGVGYTYMRIRGTDASRINVTINGIPVNDAESHGVFFVNMPDFASSIESVDIQRGAGTSTNGVGAFGASVNLYTDFRSQTPYAEVNNSIGSFGTVKNTVKFGTGVMNRKISFEGRLSKVKSDGFVDRASSDLQSYFFSGQYASGKNSLRFITFSGKETTYQAWGGIPRDSLKTNRTYNLYTYENEVDDYQQTHYQLFFDRKINSKLFLNTALHYTRGQGYFEQYREDDDMSTYGIDPVFRANDTLTNTDLIRRRWLDNDYYGGIFALKYKPNNKIQSILGGGYNIYDGDHFGEVIWARYSNNLNIRGRYYNNNATKTDGNIYSKTNVQVSKKMNAFLDLQVRQINYNFFGFDNELKNVQQDANYFFFNPKIGASYALNSSSKFYTLLAIANKEPNRDDLTESSPTSRPKHETLYDLELGFKQSKSKYALSINGYFMLYSNQLVATGALNDVGASVRTNIEDSYRTGIEIEGGVQITKGLKWSGNLTLSQNKIQEWTEYVDNWDTWGKDTIVHTNSTLAFSPSVIASSIFEFSPYKQWDGARKKNRIDKLSIALISKYVGEQFVDNTQSQDRKLESYFIHDLRVNYSLKFRSGLDKLTLFGSIYNLTNQLYSANAWSYRYSSGGESQQQMGFYPQASTNLLIGLNLKF